MQLTMLKSKIHRATITGANLNYEGSISIDKSLLSESGIRCHEQVHVVNVNNGVRLITYAIEAEFGSGEIALNGAAARLGALGDVVIILAYCNIEESECERYFPKVVLVDSKNRITKVT